MQSLLCLLFVLFLSACVNGYNDDWTFSPGVTGVTLESPNPEDVLFKPSADGTSVTITWPIVFGSGGYDVSFYIMDDPENPQVVGTEHEVVDGCSVKRTLLEDTNYKVVIRTVGNEKYNNQAAVTPSEATYSTMVTATLIPDGTDLATYFANAPIPASSEELAYELVAGGNYTMSGDVNLGLTHVTIRGNKVRRPKVTMSKGLFLSDGGALKLKFIEFNCANFTGSAVVAYNATQNANAIANGWVTVTSPVAFQSCRFVGLPKPLLHDGNKKYAIQTLLVKDCVIEQNTATDRMIYMQGGLIKDLTISNSTISNKQINNAYFIQYSSNRVTANTAWNWANASVTLTNSTFWQVAKTGQTANYAGIAQKGNTLTIQKCIFVDSGNKAVVRRLAGGNTNMTRSLGENSYWFDGAFVSDEISANYDNSGSQIESNPALRDPAKGDFTVGGEAQIAARTGDPRWLPAAE